MNTHCIVMTTFANAEQAQPIIDAALSDKLAACVQVIDISSHYFWGGNVCHDSEVLVLFKTTRAKYDALEQKIRELHPYDLPEVVAVNIGRGFSGYLKWIDKMTGTA